jgi:hypothetical protein
MRTIDWDAPLSAEDKAWALDRDMAEKVAENEARFAEAAKTDDSGDGSTPDDDYDKWKVEELKAEAEGREPAVDLTGKTLKADIIAALREWDAAYPDASS